MKNSFLKTQLSLFSFSIIMRNITLTTKRVKEIVLFLTLAVTMTSCLSTQSMKALELSGKKLNLPFKVEAIEFIDSRDSVSKEADIALPFISFPGQKRYHYPSLSAMHKDVIVRKIHENLSGDSTQLSKITVEFLKGEKFFSAGLFDETEAVKIKLRLTIENAQGRTSSEAEFKTVIKSMDAKNSRFEEQYQATLKSTIYLALGLLQNIEPEKIVSN